MSIATSSLAFPAVIFRFESYLIATDACSNLGLSLPLSLSLEAMTKDSDNTEDPQAEQIRLQRGMGKNYERLEFLGDAFLKMAVTIALFAQNPHDQEFDYHVNRMCLICNRNLFKTARQLELYKYIRSHALSRSVTSLTPVDSTG
jgi:endoribonuclease Dicer